MLCYLPYTTYQWWNYYCIHLECQSLSFHPKTQYYAGEDVVIGFESSSLTIEEGDGTAVICAQVTSGTLGNRTFTVNYQTSDDAATGRYYNVLIL